ncbi:MAG: hypothetical protein ABGZ17_10380 [Planctomycetaceae bacterium]
MNLLIVGMICAAAETQPLIVVTNPEQVANVPANVSGLRVRLPNSTDADILAAVLKHAPHIRRLEIDHSGNGVPVKVIEMLSRFQKLKQLEFVGDANLDDKTFALIGKLNRLKSLRLKLP